jgi:hypothetical protein
VDLSKLESWHYGLLIGGALLVVGILLYFLGVRQIKVPAAVTAGFAGLAVGLAAGIVWLGAFGYKPVETPRDDEPGAGEGGGPPRMAGGPKMGGGGAPKMGGGGGAPKSGGGPPAPSPRAQLLALIDALDRVLDRPVTVTLTTDERAAVARQLKGLDAAPEVKDDEAKDKLDAILKVVEKDRKALEAVGYRWPIADPKAESGGPPQGLLTASNPFHEPNTAAKVQSVAERLAKKK